jgi:hypothetical protein
MDNNSDLGRHSPLSGSERVDAVPARKAWKTPVVITGSEVQDTENSNGGANDGSHNS